MARPDDRPDADGTDGEETVAEPSDLKYVGAATASVFEAAGIDAAAVPEKRVSHAQLVAAGVNPGVAAKIRRWHSLPWTFEGGEDLDRRAEQVRGLEDSERAWVAASSGDWEEMETPSTGATTDGSGAAAAEESAWRERSKPTPVTELDGIGESRAETLAEAGINSVRSLALADPEQVASSLELPTERVAAWREQAQQTL